MIFLLKGIIIGFAIAAPVGPIGVLCISRSLSNGRISGFITGLGAASADAIYGVVAGFGITVVSYFLLRQQLVIESVGLVFLFCLGLKTFFSRPKDDYISERTENTFLFDYASTFFLTITNPMTILSFLAVFAGLGLGKTANNYFGAAMLVAGIFMGSALWWLVLSWSTGFLHKRLNVNILRQINRGSGVIIIIFVLWISVDIILKYF